MSENTVGHAPAFIESIPAALGAFALLYLQCPLVAGQPKDGIEMMALDQFPKDRISHHFGCPESEQFATNCACHIKCNDPSCSNARAICLKYKESHGCRYMLTRKVAGRKLATLKRVPMGNESMAYDVSMYPKTGAALKEYPNYTRYSSRKQAIGGGKKPPGWA